jgi:hypothetical protein
VHPWYQRNWLTEAIILPSNLNIAILNHTDENPIEL